MELNEKQLEQIRVIARYEHSNADIVETEYIKLCEKTEEEINKLGGYLQYLYETIKNLE